MGGCDDGIIQMYNVDNIMSGDNKVDILSKKHSGPVRALDFNKFQKQLLASGGPDSEILVWDLLHSSGTSCVPLGTKMTPSEDIVSLSWNNQVHHILASVLPSKCVIWDLRKAEPIIKVTDGSISRIKWCSVSWNPDIATQLCLASEDDSHPVVEIWDLRFATTPIKVLQGHNRGVMSVCWCPNDSELVLGCGKYDHVICWNPNSITSIADSFPGIDTYAETTGPVHQIIAKLKKPPKWFKKPAGAKFAVSYPSLVSLIARSRALEASLEVGEFSVYCSHKLSTAADPIQADIWRFVSTYFDREPRYSLLGLLGYPRDALSMNSVDVDINNEYLDDNDTVIELNASDDLTKALLLGNIAAAVDICIAENNYADAFLLASAGDESLQERTKSRYFQANKSNLSHLMRAVVSRDWKRLVEKCDLTHWIQVLVAIVSQAEPSQLSTLCQLLGKRLEAQGGNLAIKAELCYIVSGNINNLVEAWMKTNNRSVQDLVEVVLILQKALQIRGQGVPVGGTLAQLLSTYAEMLATQGDLETALSYLSLSNSTDENTTALKSHIQCALGVKPARQPSVSGHYFSQNSMKRTSLSASSSNSVAPPPTVLNNTMAPPPTVLNNTMAPPPTVLNNTMAPPPTVLNNTMAPPPTVLNNTMAPPPTVLNNTMAPPPTVLNNTMAPPPTVLNNTMAPPPTVLNNTMAPPPTVLNNTMAPPPAVATPNVVPTGPPRISSKYVVDPSLMGGSPYSRPQSSLAAPVSNNTFQPITSAEPPNINSQPIMGAGPPNLTSNHKPPEPGSYMSTQRSFTPGWNDPPVLSSITKPVCVNRKPAVVPIMHPLFDVSHTQRPSEEYHQKGDLAHQPYFRNPQAESTPSVCPLPPLQLAREALPLPTKRPLPEEHMHIQTVCDELRQRVYNTATNPVSKKKLEEVARKLNLMYDVLRVSKLSPSVTQSLHHLIQCLQQGDYNGALAVHTQMVSGPDFSNIASFMPALKILIQIALQNGVYL
ncbi:hypothetical protein M8J76_001088 [Diaphorina citri]|nr:hypothetical protein M8J76_001088 [Diaphorina citri]